MLLNAYCQTNTHRVGVERVGVITLPESSVVLLGVVCPATSTRHTAGAGGAGRQSAPPGAESRLLLYDCTAAGRRLSFDDSLDLIGLSREDWTPEETQTFINVYYGLQDRTALLIR